MFSLRPCAGGHAARRLCRERPPFYFFFSTTTQRGQPVTNAAADGVEGLRPFALGERLHGRYEVTEGPGLGCEPGAWLARDLYRQGEIVTLKVVIPGSSPASPAVRGPDIVRHIAAKDPNHGGFPFVRAPRDSFALEGSRDGRACLVFGPPPLEDLATRHGRTIAAGAGAGWRTEEVRGVATMVLRGLEYLHEECGVIHTDLKPETIVFKNPSSSAQLGAHSPPPSPPNSLHEDQAGQLEIAGLEAAVRDDYLTNHGRIQTLPYRGPEVILDVGYSYSTDVWCLGLILCNLLKPEGLFAGLPRLGGHDRRAAEQAVLARVARLLGPPPWKLLEQGELTPLFKMKDGTFVSPSTDEHPSSLEDAMAEARVEDKDLFLAFVRRMLRWTPEERSSARDLLTDPWLCRGS